MAFYEVLDESLKRCDIEGDLGNANLNFIPQYEEEATEEGTPLSIPYFDYESRIVRNLSESSWRFLSQGCLIVNNKSINREKCKTLLMAVSRIGGGLASLLSWQLHLKTDGDQW